MINNGSQTEGKEQGILKTGMIKKGEESDCESDILPWFQLTCGQVNWSTPHLNGGLQNPP